MPSGFYSCMGQYADHHTRASNAPHAAWPQGGARETLVPQPRAASPTDGSAGPGRPTAGEIKPQHLSPGTQRRWVSALLARVATRTDLRVIAISQPIQPTQSLVSERPPLAARNATSPPTTPSLQARPVGNADCIGADPTKQPGCGPRHVAGRRDCSAGSTQRIPNSR